MERWKQVVGFEGLYEVSDQGRVRSIDRVIMVERYGSNYAKHLVGKVLAGGKDTNGYWGVQINRRFVRIASIILEAFVGSRPNDYEALHKDDNKNDNSLSNLYWGTRGDNRNDHYIRGIGNIKCVIRNDGTKYSSCREADRLNNLSYGSVSGVCSGRRKSAGGYGWQYNL